MSKTKLGEATNFPYTPAYDALTEQQKVKYVRNDACASGYAWGRLDQGHPAFVALEENSTPSTTDTAWAFGRLYAQMLLELHDATHRRTFGFSIQSAWAVFAETGCPDGNLPPHLS